VNWRTAKKINRLGGRLVTPTGKPQARRFKTLNWRTGQIGALPSLSRGATLANLSTPPQREGGRGVGNYHEGE